VHLAPAEVVYERASAILQEAGHTGRMWIQISENVPPEAWRTSVPAIVNAVRDFGQP
jgi:hypothetical protein